MYICRFISLKHFSNLLAPFTSFQISFYFFFLGYKYILLPNCNSCVTFYFLCIILNTYFNNIDIVLIPVLVNILILLLYVNDFKVANDLNDKQFLLIALQSPRKVKVVVCYTENYVLFIDQGFTQPVLGRCPESMKRYIGSHDGRKCERASGSRDKRQQGLEGEQEEGASWKKKTQQREGMEWGPAAGQ